MDSTWEHGPARMETCLFLSEAARVQVVETHGLRFDARFLARSALDARSATLFLLLDGWLAVGGRPVSGPGIWSFSVGEFERRAPAAVPFQVGGRPRRSIELCLATDDVRLTIGVERGATLLAPDLEDAARELLAGKGSEPSARVRACTRLLAALARAGICAPELATREQTSHDAGVERVAEALAQAYRRHDSGAYGKMLAALAHTSVRQATRDMASLTARYRLPGARFRDLIRVLRLRRAALLASAPELPLTELAREVGYGSVDAMARAFRDEGLPSPGAVRDALADGSPRAEEPAA